MERNAWILIVSGSLASMAGAPVLAAETGFYFSAAAGRAEENPDTSIGADFVDSTRVIHVAPTRVDVDSGDVSWSAAAGYRLNPYLAAEVEYLDLGTTHVSEQYNLDGMDPLFPETAIRFTRTYSSKVSGPALSLLGSVPVAPGFEIFLRAGAFFSERKVKLPSQLFGIGWDTSRSTVWQGGAGAAWSFASRWTLRAEYQRTGMTDATSRTAGADTERMSLSLLFRL